MQNETDAPFDSSNESAHVTNVGRLVEDMENRMRNTLSEIYFSSPSLLSSASPSFVLR